MRVKIILLRFKYVLANYHVTISKLKKNGNVFHTTNSELCFNLFPDFVDNIFESVLLTFMIICRPLEQEFFPRNKQINVENNKIGEKYV